MLVSGGGGIGGMGGLGGNIKLPIMLEPGLTGAEGFTLFRWFLNNKKSFY